VVSDGACTAVPQPEMVKAAQKITLRIFLFIQH
jgi:hypothetical protein